MDLGGWPTHDWQQSQQLETVLRINTSLAELRQAVAEASAATRAFQLSRDSADQATARGSIVHAGRLMGSVDRLQLGAWPCGFWNSEWPCAIDELHADFSSWAGTQGECIARAKLGPFPGDGELASLRAGELARMRIDITIVRLTEDPALSYAAPLVKTTSDMNAMRLMDLGAVVVCLVILALTSYRLRLERILRLDAEHTAHEQSADALLRASGAQTRPGE